MVNVIIGNSYSQLVALPASEFKELQRLLSYLPGGDAAAHFFRFSPKRKSLLDKNGFFPTGLLPRVVAFFFVNQIQFHQQDARLVPDKTPGMFTMSNSLTPYVDQERAVKAAAHYKRGGIVMPTGTGKSLVIALLVQQFQVKTLVVVPNVGIKTQLQAVFKTFFGDNSNLQVENIDSKALANAKDFDCLIIDECHHSAAATYQKLNKATWGNIYYRFFLSATFFRNQSNEHLLFEGLAGSPIFELTYKDAIHGRYIVPVEAYYFDVPKTEVKAHTWSGVYNQLVVNHAHRNNLISFLMLKLQAAGLPTLTLVKEISHGETLSKISGVPFVNGQDKESRQYIADFNAGRLTSLIGTEGVVGEGIDTRPCQYVIVAGLGKAKSSFMQKVGRAVRKFEGKESAKVVLIRDASHKWMLSHFSAQKKILLDEYGVKPIKLEFGGKL